LAQAGYPVTGIDLSEPMLAEARRKSAEQGVEVDWIKADVRDFDLGRQFGLVLFPANALLHLLTLEDLEGCLGSVRRHLAPQGRFAFDVFIPDLDVLRRDPGERHPFSEYADPEGEGDVAVTHSNVYDATTQINTITLYRSLPDGEEELLGTLTMRMLFPQELDALLKYNGFAIDHKYGNYDRRAFDRWAVRQLVVCHARGQGTRA
jgi:SAM-dependent methyltransferase